MPFNDIYRLRLFGTLHGAQIVNVLHFVQDDPDPLKGGLELANTFVTNMTATLRARCTSAFTYNYVEVERIVPYTGGPVTVNFPASSVGTRSGACGSAMVCEVISIYTSRGGRRGKGRFYLSGGNTEQTNGLQSGVWTAPQSTTTQNLANQFAGIFMDDTLPVVSAWRLGVWSRASGPEHPPWTTDQFTRATALVVRNTARTQRRRQVGVGR